MSSLTATPTENRQLISYFDWKNFNQSHFLDELSRIDWLQSLHPSKTVDIMLQLFTDTLLHCISKHLKLKHRYVKSRQLPAWFDQDIQESIRKRDLLKQSNCHAEYRRARNYTTNLIKRKKSNYLDNIVKNSNNRQTKKLWDIIRNKEAQSTTISSIADPTSPQQLNSSPQQIANTLNNHFTDISKLLIDSDRTDQNGTPTTYQSTATMDCIPLITVHDVILLLNGISPTKATGHDLLSPRILKISTPFIALPITEIINRSISEGIFPSLWKTAIVTPIHKSGPTTDPSNYRPISVLPVLSKIFEKHVLKHLITHLESNKLINLNQSGFRKNHSCITALHKTISDWLDKLKEHKPTLIIFLDFCKAFDMVDHQILLNKLLAKGISGNFHSLIKSYLSARTQMVKIGPATSNPRQVHSGVPQGSILGPTLFLIFIDDLLNLKLNMKMHAYADDTTFYLSDENTKTLQIKAQHDLDIIESWCRNNKMLINTKKSHYLLCSTTQSTVQLKVRDENLVRKQSSKLLGLSINDKLTWSDHVKDLLHKISSNLRLFYLTRHLMNQHTARNYYMNFIHSYLTYGLHIYYPLAPNKLTNPLYLAQKKGIRLVKLVLRRDKISTATLCKSINVLPLPKLAEYFTGIFAHRTDTLRQPSYITHLFSHRPTAHNCSLRNSYKLPSSYTYNALNSKTVILYNSLPLKIRSTNSLTAFKRRLLAFLLD